MKMCIIKTPTLTHLLMYYRPMIMTMMHSFKIAGGEVNAHIWPLLHIKLGNMHSLVQMSNIFAYLDILKYHNVSQMCNYDWDVLKTRKNGCFLNA